MTIATDVSTAVLKVRAPGQTQCGQAACSRRAGQAVGSVGMPCLHGVSSRLARGDLHPETPCGMMRERVVPACFPANSDSKRQTDTPDCPWRTTDHVELTRGPGGPGSGFSRNPRQDPGNRRGPRSDRSGACSPPSPSRPEGRPDSPGPRVLCEPGPGRSETIQLIFSLEYDQNWRDHLKLRQPAQSPGTK